MERVWDYPRPPAVVPCERRVRVELGRRGSGRLHPRPARARDQPPADHLRPAADVREELLAESDARPTWCELKRARYLDAVVAAGESAVAWPSRPLARVRGSPPSRRRLPRTRRRCLADDERVKPSKRLLRRVDHRRPRGAIQRAGRHARLVKSRPVDAPSPAAIPEVASVEVVEVLLKHSAARLMTSRATGLSQSMPWRCSSTRGLHAALHKAGAATAALDDLVGESRRSLCQKQSRTTRQIWVGPRSSPNAQP